METTMSIARRTFLRRLASAGGAAVVTPSLAGLVACGDTTGLDFSGNRDSPVELPDIPDKPSANPIIKPYGDLVRSLDCPEFEIPCR
jgi:hypothetical protein